MKIYIYNDIFFNKIVFLCKNFGKTGVYVMNGEETVRAYADMVYGIAMKYMRDPYDAEDILSETFITYFKKERTFEGEEHRKAWLIKVTINTAKDFLSARR